MPIYEYTCGGCGHAFEEFVRKPDSAAPKCPECGAEKSERQISLPRVHSENTRANSLAAAKRHEKAVGAEMAHAQRQYELSHND